MREPVRDQGRLRHILGAIDNVLEFMEGKTTADLRQDRILFYAVVKNDLLPLKEQIQSYLAG